MIFILNYEAGNIRSIVRAVDKLGYEYKLIKKYSEEINSNILLIPGVGNFYKSSIRLKDSGFFNLKKLNPNKRPYIIGICLGMQLLFSKSFEGGESEGLGILEGNIIKTPLKDSKNNSIRETLIGWESLKIEENEDTPSWLYKFKDSSFYHIHGYMACPEETKNIYARYPGNLSIIPTIVGSNLKRTIGFQFHPEKSGVIGLELLNEAIKNVV